MGTMPNKNIFSPAQNSVKLYNADTDKQLGNELSSDIFMTTIKIDQK